MANSKNLGIFVLTISLLVFILGGCASTKLNVIPEKVSITPDLLKNPIKFSSTGFSPKEAVTIELIVPKGVQMKGLRADENRVGIAVANADDKGNFEVPIAAISTLNSLFQVGFTSAMTPDFKQAKPLPAGKYDIIATGLESNKVAKGVMEIVPPPSK
jgi:hypothetical protein